MKRLLLNFILLSLPMLAFSQVPNGSKLAANITGTDVITDGQVDVQAWLDDEQTVILDVFATWCGPCWSFHESGFLKELHDLHGPDGDNTLRILAIEGDSRTTSADMVGTGSNTLGNWLEGVEYDVIDSDAHNGTLSVNFFPTLYVVRPDGTILEMGDFRGNAAMWDRILFPASKDAALLGSVSAESFCDDYQFGASLPLLNVGETPIETAVLTYSLNGEAEEIVVNDLGVFSETRVILPPAILTESADISLQITTLDGEMHPADADFSQTGGAPVKAITTQNSIKLAFTTDVYPGELSWTLTTELGDLLASDSYSPGPGAGGSGGADANKTFEYDVWIGNTDVECLSVNITDSYGDGFRFFTANDPLPGVEIFMEDGTLIKPWMASDVLFTSTNRIEFGAELMPSNTSLEDVVTTFEVFPNPVSDVLNLDIQTSEEYHLEVSNMTGQMMFRASSAQNSLDVSTLTSGTYLISLRTKSGVMTKRFLKL